MQTPAPHILTQDGQRISKDTFATKEAADAAAAELNKAKLKEAQGKSQPLVESKQVLMG